MTTAGNSRTPEWPEVLDIAISSFIRDVNVSLPGRIESYDETLQKATVKPLVKRLLADENGEEILETLPVLPGVPVVFPRGGGFFISMPVKPGDFCLLVFNSFPIDKYIAGDGKDTNPDDFDTHNMSDAVALMGFAPFSKAIAGADPDNLVMGKENGPQIHLADDKIELGEKGSGDWVTKDSLNQAELSRLKSELDAFKSTFDAHTHTLAISAEAGSGGSGTAAAPASGFPPPSSPGSTKSDLVTLKE